MYIHPVFNLSWREARLFCLAITAAVYFLGAVLMPRASWGLGDYRFKDHVTFKDGVEINWTKGWIKAPGLSFAASEELDRDFSGAVLERVSRLNASKNLFQTLIELPAGHAEQNGPVPGRADAKSLEKELKNLVFQAELSDVVRISGNGLLFETYLRLDTQDPMLRMLMPDLFFMQPEFDAEHENTTAVTGNCLIFIDASQADLSAAIAPSVVDEQGGVLFRASIFGGSPEQDKPAVSYAASSAEPMRFRPVQTGEHALWIRAAEASGSQKTSPVLDEQAAGRFMDMLSSHEGRCSVIILVK